MRRPPQSSAWLAFPILGLVAAADVVYVSDLKLYSSLAPCAASAIYYNIDSVRSTSQCSGDESQLHSCVCSHTADFNSISSAISSRMSFDCSVSAGVTDDFWSASQVLKKYCNPSSIVTFPEPEIKVNAFINELSQMTNLASCAQTALSYVYYAASDRCPKDATLNAPCVCSKTGVVDDINRTLRTVARSSCSNNEDATSVVNFFSEFCALNQGKSSFAGPKNPPGDMTYQITALPQYKSLQACAQSAFTPAVLAQTDSYCLPGPQAFASCICLKSGMFDRVSSSLTSSVKWECDSYNTAAVTSAVSVLNYYCNAAKNKVVATVQVEASTTEGSLAPTSTPPQSRTSSMPPSDTSGPRTGADTSNGDGNEAEKVETTESGVNRTAIIAAAVLGAFLFLVAIAAVVFFVRRRRRRSAKGEEIPSGPGDVEFQEYKGKPELAGPDPVISHPGTGNADVDTLKPELPTEASINELPTPTTPVQTTNMAFPSRRSVAVSEMSPSDTVRPELPVTTSAAAMAHTVSTHQPSHGPVSPNAEHEPSRQRHMQSIHGFSGPYPVSPQSSSGSPVDRIPVNPPPASQNGWQQPHELGWQSGPVQAYEMDGTGGRDR